MPNDNPQSSLFYVASTCDGKGDSVCYYRFDPDRGELEPLGGTNDGVRSGLFVAVDPQGKWLFVADNDSDDASSGAVAAYRIDRGSGKPCFLNRQPSGGNAPCYLDVARDGKYVLVANYTSGNVCVLPIGDDGYLGPPVATVQHEGSSVNPKRQDGPHAHSFLLDPENRFALAGDLGLDKVIIYRFDPTHGKLAPAERPEFATEPGSGPRHISFHPNGHLAYVITELENTIMAMKYEPGSGRLEHIQTISALPNEYTQTSYCADVHVHPTGRFLYGSNRGHESIAIFSIDESNGKLTSVGHEPTQGKFPRDFAIDPTGAYLLAANEHSGSIVTFRIDLEVGSLRPSGNVVHTPNPACCAFA